MTFPTNGLIARIKREAKLRVRQKNCTHSEALETLAKEYGFSSWHDLLNRRGMKPTTPPGETYDLPLDPLLPPDFDDTPNERRSRKQLDAWWDRPFAVSRPDGRYDVRCLHGGAWDRSSWLGTADDLLAATELAREKLHAWQRQRAQPVVMLDEQAFMLDKPVLVVQMPDRPDRRRKVLAKCESLEAATAWIDQWRKSQDAI